MAERPRAESPVLDTVRGQATAVETLKRALRGDRVHHACLFDGPDGVGKERAAFGLAQALVCETRAAGTADACGRCGACRRAVPAAGEARPTHPDVTVIERGLYDPAVLGRRSPETQDISIDQIRTLVLARAAFAPTEGRAKVFLVRRAEELSAAAANSLLKTLEEPGPRTHFVLLSAVADSLLPTIRSRVQRVRFGPLGDAIVVDLLVERGIDRDRATELARLGAGSMSAALAFADPDATEKREDLAQRAMAALRAQNLAGALEVAEEAKKLGKEPFAAVLEAFATSLAASVRSAVLGIGGATGRDVETGAARYSLILAAMRELEMNASVQLATEAMFIKMRGS
ncbi:MAG: ATP-binding protein [Polyangiaceae bacterium]